MKTIITKNEKESFELGQSLGKKCKGGEIFLLSGNLGSGKTKLAQGLAAGLGLKQKVNSPTFNILKLYPLSGKIKQFCHIDTYRLQSEQDLIFLGIEELFDSPNLVIAIEWPEKIKKIWPKRAKLIKIKIINETEREININ